MMPFATCVCCDGEGINYCEGLSFVNGIFHNTLLVRLPFIIISLCLTTWTSYIEKIAMQSSLHNWPINMRVPLCRLSKLKATRAFGVNLCERVRMAFLARDITRPSATATLSPVVFFILLHI